MTESINCHKCKTPTRRMDHFYICPNCMEDYASQAELADIRALYARFNQDKARVLAEVQRQVDEDREKLRLIVEHQEVFKKSLDLIFETHRNAIGGPNNEQ